MKEQAFDELNIKSKIVRPLIAYFYRESANDSIFLSKTASIQGIIESSKSDDEQNLLWRQKLQGIFKEFIKNKPIYKNISYLATENNVRSIISVDNKNEQVKVIPFEQSSQNITLDSLKAALLVEQGEVYFSEISYQKGIQGRPLQSSLFIGTPIYTADNELFGSITIEVDFSLFIERLKENALEKVTFYLANSAGDFIYFPVDQKIDKNNINIIEKFPSLSALFSSTATIDEFLQDKEIEVDNKLAYYSTVQFTGFGQLNPLHLVIENKSNIYLQSLERMRTRAIFFSFILAVLSLVLCVMASKRITRALLLMTNSVAQYEEQGVIGQLPVQENDEIGALARSFQNLLMQIEQKSIVQKSETMRAEDALAKLYSILNSIADGVINIDDKGYIIAFNHAAEKIFGYQTSEVIGKNALFLVPIDNTINQADEFQKFLQRSSSDVKGRALELTAMRKNGEKFFMHLSVSKVNVSGDVVFTGLIRDITENKLLAAERVRSVEKAEDMAWRLNFALSAPKIGVWDYDIQSGVSHWDSRMYELFGCDKDSTVPTEKIWRAAIHIDDLKFVEEQFIREVKKGIALNFEYRITLPDLTTRYIETHTQVVSDKNQNNFRVVGTHRDITEQRNLRTLKQNALDMAEQALLLRSQFLASMSHEIRTPMNGVLGMLGLLQQGNIDKQQAHHLQLASSSAQSLLSLINDILDFSKIEAGKLELEILDFDIRSQLGDFAESMAIKAQEKGLELILDVCGVEQSLVRGDPSRLRQILSNLVSNSIKFTESGEVLIKASIKKHQHQLQLICTISDTGIGIPESKMTALFDSFTQVDASTTRKYGGTGLGLAIVKQLAQLMSGDITVTSTEGQGSAFTFTILLNESENSQKVMPQVDIKGKQILIVDDNATNLAVLKGQLAIWGAEVTEAQDGFTALEQVVNHPAGFFDAAILDMQMPGMDGVTLGKRLKVHRHTQQTKLIMMTSMSDSGDTNFFEQLGFSAYFPKPATTADLFDTLTIVLDDEGSLNLNKPFVTQHNVHKLKHPSANRVIAKNTRILLVEDNRINQVVILGVLANIGLSADVAGNGIEALAALNISPEDAPYQIIIMDCQMPEMDGYDATRAIRAGEAGVVHRNIPIIAMTANAMKGDKEKCLAAGMSDYASKPVDTDILLKKISTWVGIDTFAADSDDNIVAITELVTESDTGDTAEDSRSKTNEDIIWDKAGFLKRIRNNDKLSKQLITLFIEDMPALKNELISAMENELFNDIIALAHKITGSSKNLGGINLGKLTRHIEQSARIESSGEMLSLQNDLTREYDLLIDTLQKFLTTKI
ncbi:response regulator [Colwellia hornerae]|uniref:histidine kinase n=1 Tax=Colwellia hornerae TaxID=89402 RepID=A0A5C6QHS0_9GAMM|nr:response regulator [Colwellia hornerae]TWX52838.1 response regulator [Colwellia hornerae]TWX59192.1 response regulator [Colwellia hornerae]TWX68220.1 response regulator [Colwellia hornerae]